MAEIQYVLTQTKQGLKEWIPLPTGGVSAHSQAWSTILNTPTSLAGYGITDAVIIYPSSGIPKSLGSSWDDSYDITGSGKVVLDTAPNLQTSIKIGTETTGDDQECAILISKIKSVAGNAHGISDYTSFLGDSYACFDARVATSGSGNYGHLIAFQAAMEHASSGTLGIMYGGGASIPYNNGGLITDLYGWRANDLSGTGTAANVYGFYCEELTKGTNKYAFYSKGATQSLFEGTVNFGNGTQGYQLIKISNTLGDLYVGSMTTSSWAGITNRLGILNAANYAMVISNNENQPIVFGVNDTETGRFDTDGDFKCKGNVIAYAD